MLAMRPAHFVVFVGLAAGLVAWTAAPSFGDSGSRLKEALGELRASDEEWRQNDRQFRSLRASQDISGIAAEEFATFVADLHRRMLESCHAFRKLGGDPESNGFDCDIPAEERALQQALPQNPMTVQTEEEKTAALDAALDQSLSEFDEALQSEQSELRDQRKSRNSGGQDSDSQGTAQTGGGADRAIWSNPDSPSGQPRPAESGAVPGVDKRPPAPLVASPGDSRVGAGDDNVVARQLREAAENETDPILKEKLWAEYRKYRTGNKDSN